MNDQQSEQGTQQLIAWMRHEAALRRHERDHTSENLEAAADRLEALEAIVARLRKSVANAERIDLLTDEASVVVVRFVDPMSKDAARLHDLMTLEAAQQRGGA